MGDLTPTPLPGDPTVNDSVPSISENTSTSPTLYYLEDQAFDSYATSGGINNVWEAVKDKVPVQTDRLVIDLTGSSLSFEDVAQSFNSAYGKYNLNLLQEAIFMKDGQIIGIWVQP